METRPRNRMGTEICRKESRNTALAEDKVSAALAADKRGSRHIRNAAACTGRRGKARGMVPAASRAVDAAADKDFAGKPRDGTGKPRDGTRKIRNIR